MRGWETAPGGAFALVLFLGASSFASEPQGISWPAPCRYQFQIAKSETSYPISTTQGTLLVDGRKDDFSRCCQGHPKWDSCEARAEGAQWVVHDTGIACQFLSESSAQPSTVFVCVESKRSLPTPQSCPECRQVPQLEALPPEDQAWFQELADKLKASDPMAVKIHPHVKARSISKQERLTSCKPMNEKSCNEIIFNFSALKLQQKVKQTGYHFGPRPDTDPVDGTDCSSAVNAVLNTSEMARWTGPSGEALPIPMTASFNFSSLPTVKKIKKNSSGKVELKSCDVVVFGRYTSADGAEHPGHIALVLPPGGDSGSVSVIGMGRNGVSILTPPEIAAHGPQSYYQWSCPGEVL